MLATFGGVYALYSWMVNLQTDTPGNGLAVSGSNPTPGTSSLQQSMLELVEQALGQPREPTPRVVIPDNARAASPNQECLVCRDEPQYFPKDPPTSHCSHAPEVCSACLGRTIQEAVKHGNYNGDGTQIRCPSYNCDQWMGYLEIRQWAPNDVCEKYDNYLLNRSLRSDALFVRCVNPKCSAGQVHTEKGNNPIVICYSCRKSQCFNHRIEWHAGYTCKQWDKQGKHKKANDLSKKFISKTTKACPKCKRPILKINGCDHMTCKRPGGCGHEFCWLCLAPWRRILAGDNSKHYDHCKYYTGKKGGHPAPRSLRPAGQEMRWWKIWRVF